MATKNFVSGDWIQAGVDIFDEEILAGPKGQLGHVVEDPDSSGWPTVFFESTGRTTICHPEEVIFLGHADTGRTEKRVSSPTPIPGTVFAKRKAS